MLIAQATFKYGNHLAKNQSEDFWKILKYKPRNKSQVLSLQLKAIFFGSW